LANYFNVSIDYLLGRIDDRKNYNPCISIEAPEKILSQEAQNLAIRIEDLSEKDRKILEICKYNRINLLGCLKIRDRRQVPRSRNTYKNSGFFWCLNRLPPWTHRQFTNKPTQNNGTKNQLPSISRRFGVS